MCTSHEQPLQCAIRSGLVRHELSLVSITYADGIDQTSAKCTKQTKPPLPLTVLVHYINGEVETDTDVLPFANPPNPLIRLKEKTLQPARLNRGTSSQFQSLADIEAELQQAQVASPSARVTPQAHPAMSAREENDFIASLAEVDAEAFVSSALRFDV